MEASKEKQYIYIVQASLEPTKCKIGKTNDLERRLKEYNNMTGKSMDNVYQYLFTCEVKDAARVKSELNQKYRVLRVDHRGIKDEFYTRFEDVEHQFALMQQNRHRNVSVRNHGYTKKQSAFAGI
jgi:predicted GIY-YIG superfamily endonuclease